MVQIAILSQPKSEETAVMNKATTPQTIPEILERIETIRRVMEGCRQVAGTASCPLVIGRINADLAVYLAEIAHLQVQAAILIAEQRHCTSH